MAGLDNIQVLLVDDHAKTLVMMRTLLRAGGVLRIAAAEHAIEAFDIMAASRIDLVLVDWRMHPVDGIEFTRLVRTSPHSPNPFVPILMLTAHTEESRVAAARDAGVTGFVRKPIQSKVLFERIAAALLDERMFVRTEGFCGPDRRRAQTPNYRGPLRRASDHALSDDTFDLDDLRIGA